VMMTREEIDEARAQGNQRRLQELRESLVARRETAMQSIAQRAGELRTAADGEKKEFRKLLNAVKYFENLLSHVASDPLTERG